ncbi:MAG: peptidase U37 [Alphaproteobacteria bacterium]|nr:peptidase U37 [Alphaproteobacteria bacterium]
MPEPIRTRDLPVQTRMASVLPSTVNAESRTVELVWSTGAAVRRRDWMTDEPYDEVLSLEAGHVDLSRLNSGAPFLNTHGARDLSGVLGVVERAWIADGPEGRAIVRFSDREEVAPIWNDIASGIIRNVSVGYSVLAFEITDGDVPVWRATDWIPLELSAVPIGADPGAGFRSAEHLHPCQLRHRQEDRPMPEAPKPPRDPARIRADESTPLTIAGITNANPCVVSTATSHGLASGTQVLIAGINGMIQLNDRTFAITTIDDVSFSLDGEDSTNHGVWTDGGTVTPVPQTQRHAPTKEPVPDVTAIVGRAIAAERTRSHGIHDAGTKLGIPRAVSDDLVARGVTLDEARKLMIDAAAKKDAALDTRAVVTRDEQVTRRSAVEGALLHRFNPSAHPLNDAAREWRGLSLLEMSRALMEADGVRVKGMTRDEIATRALHAGSDFPVILAGVTNRTLRAAYEAAPRTFMPFCREVTATDFKMISRVQLGEAPALIKVDESGEITRGSIGEGKESYRIDPYSRIFAVTRQVLINDDLDAFTRVPQLFGDSAARTESNIVWSIFTANQKMADGKALFHADHKNLSASGTKIGVDAIGKARVAMARQTGVDGTTVLNLRPAFLIVPVSLEMAAEQLIAVNIVPAKTSDVVPNSIRSLQVIAEPRLDDVSILSWYMAASPAQIDTIEYAYLEGKQGVSLETRMGFDVDGMEIKATLDFGAKAIDSRGFYKDPGSAT